MQLHIFSFKSCPPSEVPANIKHVKQRSPEPEMSFKESENIKDYFIPETYAKYIYGSTKNTKSVVFGQEKRKNGISGN